MKRVWIGMIAVLLLFTMCACQSTEKSRKTKDKDKGKDWLSESILSFADNDHSSQNDSKKKTVKRDLLDDDDDFTRLAFYYGDPSAPTENDLILTGIDVESAEVGIDPYDNSNYIVSLELKDSGKKAFKEATERQVAAGHAPIAIWWDNQRISAPNVQSVISDGSAQISGGFDLETANELANYINNGCGNVEKATFTVGFDSEFPPYSYLDTETGEYTGFDLALAEEVCKRNGWELEKKPINWDAKDMELDSDSIDCIWSGLALNGSEEQYTFSKPYVDNSQVVVVRKGEIKDLAGLKGKVVEVKKESSAEAALRGNEVTEENKKLAAGFKKLVALADYNTVLMDLESGICDAVAMDIGVAKYKVKENNKLVILDTPIIAEQYAIGFKKGNDKLRDKVQATLDRMVADGTVAKIAEEWGLSDFVCLE